MQTSRLCRNVTAAIILGELFSSGMFQSAYQQHFTIHDVSVHIASVPFKFTIFFSAMLATCSIILCKGKSSRNAAMLGLVLWLAGQLAASVYLPDPTSMMSVAELQTAYLTSCYMDAFFVRMGGGLFMGDLLSRTPRESSFAERYALFCVPFVYVILCVPIASPIQDFRTGAMTALASATASAYCCFTVKSPRRETYETPTRRLIYFLLFFLSSLFQTYTTILPFALMWELLQQLKSNASMILVSGISLALGAMVGSIVSLYGEGEQGRLMRFVMNTMQLVSLTVWLALTNEGIPPGVLMFFVGVATVAQMVAFLRKGRTPQEFTLAVVGMLFGSLILTVLRRTQVEYGHVAFGTMIAVGVGFSAALVILGFAK